MGEHKSRNAAEWDNGGASKDQHKTVSTIMPHPGGAPVKRSRRLRVHPYPLLGPGNTKSAAVSDPV